MVVIIIIIVVILLFSYLLSGQVRSDT